MNQHWKNQYCSVQVVKNPELPEHMERVFEVIALFTDPEQRNKGYASELMKEVCAEADEHAIVLMLKPEKFGKTGGYKDLKKFYEKFGFFKMQDSPVLMVRAPTFNPKRTIMAQAMERLNG